MESDASYVHREWIQDVTLLAKMYPVPALLLALQHNEPNTREAHLQYNGCSVRCAGTVQVSRYYQGRCRAQKDHARKILGRDA